MTDKIHDSLELSVQTDAIAQAMDWVDGVAEREDWPPKLRFGFSLSLDEALTNIVSYAFADGYSAQPRLRLEYTRDGDRLSVCVIDNGKAFDPTQLAAPTLALSLDDAEIGGHGVSLMRHYLDDLVYERRGDENRLTLFVSLT
ncbi:ATP-binding protein [Pigmentiphaga aceris]|uniref:ATP-binding protein n=1 Tax=Pigmentiphaga aceris TaxID=1940612 RepID=A0A5C0AXD4_9BURK|nr:ATP-binding protein [Pigmentiphaga aceris]QEI05301.1 ATP-binding protein [Pigmentiphaga aceris]